MAKKSLLKAIELKPDFHRAILLMANIALKQGDVDTSEKYANEVLKDLASHYRANTIMGKVHLARRNWKKALERFKKVVDIQPDDPRGHYLLGIAHRYNKDHPAALASFEKALELKPQLLDAFSQIIGLHSANKNYRRALKRCDAQLDLYEDENALKAIVLNIKGRLFSSQRNYPASEETFKSAIKMDPDYTGPYYGLAQLYLVQGQQNKAIEQYKKLLSTNSEQAEPNMMIGVLYHTQKKVALAQTYYEEALRINPKFAPAANNLAYILAEQDKDLNKALELAKLAKEKLPNDPGVMDTMGWVYFKRGLYDSAIIEHADSLDKIPENPTAHYHLGMAYYKKGEKEKARVQFERALGLKENFEKSEEVKAILAEL